MILHRSPRTASFLTIALLAAVGACADSAPAPVPTTFVVVAGDGQIAAVGATLPIAPAVRILDDKGQPMEGLAVTFAVSAGGGSVEGASALTDLDGVARALSWTLGTSAGLQRLTASAAGLASLTFTATAEAGPVAALVRTSDATQDGVVGSPVVVPPAVRLVDEYENPVASAPVRFEVVAGGGEVASATAESDASGEATSSSWTLGITPGTNRLRIGFGGEGSIAPVDFEAVARAGAPAAVAMASGDGQSAAVATAVPAAPTVQVTDRYGNPVPGVGVVFEVVSGGGSVSEGSAVTDTAGVAAPAAWTLGTVSGSNALRASVEGLDPVSFTATATPGAPATLERNSDAAQIATVGSPVSVPPSVRVHDAYGNPVAGAEVAFDVTQGGGTVEAALVATDADGVASAGRWTLGPTPGANAVRASLGALTPVDFEATAERGRAAQLEVVRGAGQTGEVGTAVPEPPAVRVTDTFGNPVQGVGVTFELLTGDGALTGASTVTDGAGIAEVGSWTLGTRVGLNLLRATHADLEPVEILVTATAGAPASLELVRGSGQTAPVGTTLPVAPAVRVTDRFDNPVPGATVTFAVVAGGGSVTGGSAESDASGVAEVGSWTLGTAGANSVRASLGDLTPVEVTATATEIPAISLNLDVEAVHLNQGSQTRAGDIDGVAGRPGLLRVLVRANEANSVRPDVRVRLYDGASLVREVTVRPSGIGVPTDPDLTDGGDTWNVALTAAEVVAGLSVEVVVDPDNAIAETDEDDNRYPAGSGTASLGVVAVPDFNTLLIPIQSSFHSTLGSVTTANVETFLSDTRRFLPTSTINAVVRTPFSTNENLSTGAGWSNLLSSIQALRVSDGATDEYYHGIIGDFSGIAYGGLAYVPSSNSSSYRSALSYDRGISAGIATATIAHEYGHNLGRRHAPCGGPSGVDVNYPHPDARLGSPGYDVLSGNLVTATNYRDYMSYCGPEWTSDYTFAGVFDWRLNDPRASSAPIASAVAASFAPAPATNGLLVWGRIDATGVTLEPAFAFEAPPALPSGAGPERVRGVAADGRELFSYAFEAVRVADSNDPTERHFAFFVPMDDAALGALAALEVTSPGLDPQLQVSPAAAAPGATPAVPEVTLERPAPDRAHVRWDAARHPMVMVRDRETGMVLAFARGGEIDVALGGIPVERLDVRASDGVRTTVVEPVRR